MNNRKPMKEGDEVRGLFAHRVTGCPFCMECRQHPNMDHYVCGFVGASVTHEVDEPRIYNIWSVCQNYNARFSGPQKLSAIFVDTQLNFSPMPNADAPAKHKCRCDKRQVVNFGCKCGGE